jgi:hypothetical protein
LYNGRERELLLTLEEEEEEEDVLLLLEEEIGNKTKSEKRMAETSTKICFFLS